LEEKAMKTLVAVLMIAVMAGCAHPAFDSLYYLDREFGEAQQYTWDQQVAYPDYHYADREAEGLAGIHAEEVMNVHNSTFAKKPEKPSVLTFGITERK
jgi:hypothetical protein